MPTTRSGVRIYSQYSPGRFFTSSILSFCIFVSVLACLVCLYVCVCVCVCKCVNYVIKIVFPLYSTFPVFLEIFSQFLLKGTNNFCFRFYFPKCNLYCFGSSLMFNFTYCIIELV